MIILDTHIWIWMVSEDSRLSVKNLKILMEHEQSGLGISIISCWEIAKLVEIGKLTLDTPAIDWINQALRYPGIRLIPLTPEIVVDSTQLPGEFHKDPGDQLIVSTARIHDCPLMTEDGKILRYPHVKSIYTKTFL